MIILGIDPGTVVSGYGVLEVSGSSLKALDYGAIRPPPKLSLSRRYVIIYDAVEELLQQYRPDAVSVETQFVCRNVQSAIKLGMARGTVIVAAGKQGVPIFEYAPAKVKNAVVGKGSGSKQQVQAMVQRLLSLSALPEPEDAADALALAICHANSLSTRQKIGAKL